jgi:diguanylate cyclase (GGDEF)-like protein
MQYGGQMRTISTLHDVLGCKLCWRVTLAVFALIMVVESAILIPSAERFERTELERLADHALIAVEPVLLVGGALAGGDAPPPCIAALVGQYNLAGLALYGRDGSPLVRAGEHAGLDYSDRMAGLAGMMASQVSRSRDGSRTDVVWRSSRAGEPVVLARLDSAHIRGALHAYLLRIGGLIGIIVLVVTAGTMLVLYFAALRPLLALRRSALAAGADPDHAERCAIGSRRADEMGDVIRAHDAMLERVAESKRRDRAVAEERARYISHHQPLTGLPNRAALIDFLARCRDLSSGEGQVTLFLVNLLSFRELNASAGSLRGDDLLRRVAAAIQRTAASGDFTAHLGADRFAIVRIRAAEGSDADYAERMLRAVKNACDGAGAEALRVRVGIAGTPLGELDAPALLAQAEFALSRAREEDSGEYHFFSAQLAGEARERQALLRDLRQALAAGELYPVYQPKRSLGAVPAISGAEILLRWSSPTRGAVSPARFIPLAESSGLIVPIGDFVLHAACRQMRDWIDRRGWSPRLAVNLSAQQFSLPDLPRRLQDALSGYRLQPAMLEVEVTETAAMRDVESTAATLASLRALGVHVSIDDFGSGYSSLIYLHRFAVDAIKIDRSFVEGIGTDHHAEAICDAVLRLGQALGTRVVAEGVETETQLEFLRRRRCDEAQGYLIGKPVPAGEFERAWIASRIAA